MNKAHVPNSLCEPDTSPVIGATTQVTLHFSIECEQQLIVNTFDGQPAVCEMGDGHFLPGFEQVLYGLKAGDKQQVTLPPEQAFGTHDPQQVHTLPRGRFKAETLLQPGLILDFEQGGQHFPGVVLACTSDTVTVDFNHALAGKPIEFTVHILKLATVSAKGDL